MDREQPSDDDVELILRQYIVTALWSTNDESDERGGEPLDKNYDASDLAPETLDKMRTDCREFAKRHWRTIFTAVYVAPFAKELSDVGHDFWLTRNDHGAGFWDGDWPDEAGAELTAGSKTFGNVWLYVGDDGLIYQ